MANARLGSEESVPMSSNQQWELMSLVLILRLCGEEPSSVEKFLDELHINVNDVRKNYFNVMRNSVSDSTAIWTYLKSDVENFPREEAQREEINEMINELREEWDNNDKQLDEMILKYREEESKLNIEQMETTLNENIESLTEQISQINDSPEQSLPTKDVSLKSQKNEFELDINTDDDGCGFTTSGPLVIEFPNKNILKNIDGENDSIPSSQNDQTEKKDTFNSLDIENIKKGVDNVTESIKELAINRTKTDDIMDADAIRKLLIMKRNAAKKKDKSEANVNNNNITTNEPEEVTKNDLQFNEKQGTKRTSDSIDVKHKRSKLKVWKKEKKNKEKKSTSGNSDKSQLHAPLDSIINDAETTNSTELESQIELQEEQKSETNTNKNTELEEGEIIFSENSVGLKNNNNINKNKKQPIPKTNLATPQSVSNPQPPLFANTVGKSNKKHVVNAKFSSQGHKHFNFNYDTGYIPALRTPAMNTMQQCYPNQKRYHQIKDSQKHKNNTRHFNNFNYSQIQQIRDTRSLPILNPNNHQFSQNDIVITPSHNNFLQSINNDNRHNQSYNFFPQEQPQQSLSLSPSLSQSQNFSSQLINRLQQQSKQCDKFNTTLDNNSSEFQSALKASLISILSKAQSNKQQPQISKELPHHAQQMQQQYTHQQPAQYQQWSQNWLRTAPPAVPFLPNQIRHPSQVLKPNNTMQIPPHMEHYNQTQILQQDAAPGIALSPAHNKSDYQQNIAHHQEGNYEEIACQQPEMYEGEYPW